MAKIVLSPEWLVSSNPDVLLRIVWPRSLAATGAMAFADLSDAEVRKLRLYGVACARMVWNLLSTDAQSAVLFSERSADRRATPGDVRASAIRMLHGPVTFQQYASNAAGWASAGRSSSPTSQGMFVWNPAEAARSAAKALATRAAGPAPPGGNPVSKKWQDTWNTAFAQARAHQAELIRDIFPPPGYTPVLHPEWRTSTVVAIARQMDDTGDFSAVPILADALQDAGCDNELMLDRCRAESGIHSRGNWVVDLILGRE